MTEVLEAARRARAAAVDLRTLTRDQKDAALNAMADALDEAIASLVTANAVDVERARADRTAEAIVDRLTLTPDRIAAILGRVRAALHRNAGNAAAAREVMMAALANRRPGPQPAVASEPRALLERFRLKSEQASSTVDIVASDAEVPADIAKYLAAMKLPTTAVAWASLAALDWAGAGLKVETRGARDADLVGITGCFCAVAETGTLMMTSSPDTPAAVSLLPETHIAVVRAARIVPYMEDAWNLARAELGSLPRAVNFISGPSRTGDIEQTIVLGAHGPYRVHLVIVEG